MVDSSPQSLLHQSLEVLDKIGASPDDARDFRLQRKLLVGLSLMITAAAVIWSLIYLVFDEPIAASIPFLYAVFSLLSIIIFAFTRGYNPFRFSPS